MIKYIFYFTFLFFFSINNYSQQFENIKKDFPIFPICKLIPTSLQQNCFEESLQEHIDKNFIYPKLAIDLGLQSVVNVFFEINKEGLVENIRAKSNLVGVKFDNDESLLAANLLFEKSAKKIFSELPKMSPGKINDTISSFPFQIPVTYRSSDLEDQSNQVFQIENVEWAPLFPGCEDMNSSGSISCFKEKIEKHVKRYIRYPKKAKKTGIESIVFVEIIIENDGAIYDMTILGPDIFREEAERIIKKMPLMEPGLNNDLPVAVSYTIPIFFTPN